MLCTLLDFIHANQQEDVDKMSVRQVKIEKEEGN